MKNEPLNVNSQKRLNLKLIECFEKLEIKIDIISYQQNIFQINILPENWMRAAAALASLQARFSATWVDEYEERATIYSLYMFEQKYFLLTTAVKVPDLNLPSQASVYPAANRMERHIQDMMGIYFTDHPDNRRWTRHQAWHEKEYPLRTSFIRSSKGSKKTPGDSNYPFFQTRGSSVYEIPVGPIHAGIIEPGHFRFQAVGERVLNLEERLGYTHKGIEKIAQGKSAEDLLKLASRISGDSAVTHSWTTAIALENILHISVSKRSQVLRGVLSERERIANHIGDIGGICNDVGFAFAHHQCARLREQWLRTQLVIFGHRLLMDTIILGGVSFNLNQDLITELVAEIHAISKDFSNFIDIIQDYPSLEDRLASTGILPHTTAQQLGCLGYVGRASNYQVDIRIDNPYPPYDKFIPDIITYQGEDVLSRLHVRVDEVRSSLKLLESMLLDLPDETEPGLPDINTVSRESVGIVEGWRGEAICFVRLDDDGKVVRFFPRDPGWLNWPALEALMDNNIVPDFPVCNKSVNGSYSGVDL